MLKVLRLLLLSTVMATQVINLNTDNFDLVTQGSTWLILVCSVNRYQECRDLQPLWQRLAYDLDGVTHVA